MLLDWFIGQEDEPSEPLQLSSQKESKIYAWRFLSDVLEEMKAITPCTQEENTQLLNDAAAGNEGAKKRLIEGNLEAP